MMSLIFALGAASVWIGANDGLLEYCKPHYEMWKQFKESGGVRDVLENVVPFARLDRP